MSPWKVSNPEGTRTLRITPPDDVTGLELTSGDSYIMAMWTSRMTTASIS